MKRAVVSAALAVAIMMAALPQVWANEPKPEDVIEFRESVYEVIGWYFRPLGAMAKGDIPYDRELAIKNSGIVAAMSHIAPDAFVRGSDVGETRARPEIWTKEDQFRSAMERFQKEAATLAEVSKTGDFSAVRAQVGETGKACKNCHDDFRKKRD